jgi:isopentenyl-diphosphate Delta-isomerase
MSSSSVTNRKQAHVERVLTNDVLYTQSNGFENYRLPITSLPECNLSDCSPATTLFGKHVAMPLFISCMTGGYPDAKRINEHLALLAKKHRIAMGVGSMRAALEHPGVMDTFTTVTSIADGVPVFSNLGAAQCAAWYQQGTLIEFVSKVTMAIRADACVVHVNPLQELIQPNGNTTFRDVLASIGALCNAAALGNLPPIVVKEVGAGITKTDAIKLANVGVEYIDVAGAGGTSWAAVELIDHPSEPLYRHLRNVGTPTARCIEQCTGIVPNIWASGGITTATEVAIALAMGAKMAGIARHILVKLENEGFEKTSQMLSDWELQLQHWMFLCGTTTMQQFVGVGVGQP